MPTAKFKLKISSCIFFIENYLLPVKFVLLNNVRNVNNVITFNKADSNIL